MTPGAIVQDRLAEIAQCSLVTDGVTRLPYTAQHHAALKQIKGWMIAAGMTSHLDDPRGGPEFSTSLLPD